MHVRVKPRTGKKSMLWDIWASYRFIKIIAGSAMYKTIFERSSLSDFFRKPFCLKNTPNRIIIVGTKITSIGLAI
jgi:hypothetical protein